jgi:hypothetical protein
VPTSQGSVVVWCGVVWCGVWCGAGREFAWWEKNYPPNHVLQLQVVEMACPWALSQADHIGEACQKSRREHRSQWPDALRGRGLGGC